MESKKINQLATELAPELSDLTIIGDPTTGISKKITLSQMASLFTGTVEEYASLSAFPLVGTADTIYIALDTNILYRWNTGTSAYVELSPNIVTSLVFSDANGFDGTISLVGSTATLTITTALTQGSVPFIGTSGALTQDNANLFFDDTNNRLGINTNSPTTALDVFGSGIIGRINGTSTNNAFLGFASAGSNKWSIGNVQSDHRFRIYNEATTSELVSVLQTGEFGIGIANPTTKLHIDGGASALIANLDANVSVAKSVSFRSDNSNRINLEVSGTESGSNAGANFFIRRYSDAGALIDTPLTITRSTGAITLATELNGTSASFSSSLTATAFIPSGATIPTNGMYLSAANTLNFATNSTNRLSISSTGAATFNSTINMGSTLTIGNQGGVDTTVITGGTGFGSKISLNSSGGVACQLTGNTDSFVNVFTGNFGIGTNSPTYKLDVSGTGRFTSTLDVSGAAIFSSTIKTGSAFIPAFAGANDIVIPNNMAYRASNAANSTGFALIKLNTSNEVAINSDGATIVRITGPISMGNTLTVGNQGGVDTTVITGGSGFGSKISFNSGSGVAAQITGNTDSFVNRFTGGFGIGTISPAAKLDVSGNAIISGSLSKGSGSFRIDHPLESMAETHQLVHSFVEAPQADLYYRGKLILVNGKGQANIDEVSTMTEGTFEALCREVQCFTTNESGWDLVKGKVIGNIIYIESKNSNSTDEISWLVIGERKDKHMFDTEWTDDNGKVIVEPLKPIKKEIPIIEEEVIIEKEIIENINE